MYLLRDMPIVMCIFLIQIHTFLLFNVLKREVSNVFLYIWTINYSYSYSYKVLWEWLQHNILKQLGGLTLPGLIVYDIPLRERSAVGHRGAGRAFTSVEEYDKNITIMNEAGVDIMGIKPITQNLSKKI